MAASSPVASISREPPLRSVRVAPKPTKRFAQLDLVSAGGRSRKGRGQILREDRLPVPPEALREILLNAVMHWDYSDPGSYMAVVFRTRWPIEGRLGWLLVPVEVGSARRESQPMNGHRRIEERSLWLHRAVAEKLRRDSAVLVKARERVERWLLDGSVHPRYAEAWCRLLSLHPEEISERLVDAGETMCALRQCSPFAGTLDPRERWQILRRGEAQSR